MCKERTTTPQVSKEGFLSQWDRLRAFQFFLSEAVLIKLSAALEHWRYRYQRFLNRLSSLRCGSGTDGSFQHFLQCSKKLEVRLPYMPSSRFRSMLFTCRPSFGEQITDATKSGTPYRSSPSFLVESPKYSLPMLWFPRLETCHARNEKRSWMLRSVVFRSCLTFSARTCGGVVICVLVWIEKGNVFDSTICVCLCFLRRRLWLLSLVPLCYCP